MKILFLSHWFPYPVNNGSKLRIYNLIRSLSEYHDVTLLSFTNASNKNPNSEEQLSLCSQVEVVPGQEYDPDSQKARIGFLSFMPRYLLDIYSPPMESLIKETLASEGYDLIIASQLPMASYYNSFGNVPALFDEVELGLFHDAVIHAKGIKERFRSWLTWIKFRTYVSHLLNSFSACTVASDTERRLFISSFQKHKEKVTILPNCINFDDYQMLKVKPKENQIIFTGPFSYRVNYYAMQWFIREVFPIVLKRVPDAHLIITGDHEGLPIPSDLNVMLTGYVDDVKSLIAESRVSIAPLLSGGGTRLKILEAMALGTPVVSTSKGAEGLGAISGEHIFIADDPESFAGHIVKLLMNKELHEILSVMGKTFVKENYNWDVALPGLLQLVDRAAE